MNSRISTLFEAKKCDEAIELLNQLINLTPRSFEARLTRGDCHLHNKHSELAISDYSRAVKVKPDSTAIYLRLARLRLGLGEVGEALGEVKECLRLDPDHKECKASFKRIKKITKTLDSLETSVQRSRWRQVLDVLFEGDKFVEDVDGIGAASLKAKVYGFACSAYWGEKKAELALDWCSRVLQLDENNVDALVNRAEAYMEKEDYQEAMADYKKAHEVDRNNRKVVEGYQKAQALLKRAGQRDYYKILGVPRSASPKEIKKAFRKLAQEWHPDKYSGDLPKEEVQKKMSEINQAYEVLSKEELKERYDRGDDPNVRREKVVKKTLTLNQIQHCRIHTKGPKEAIHLEEEEDFHLEEASNSISVAADSHSEEEEASNSISDSKPNKTLFY